MALLIHDNVRGADDIDARLEANDAVAVRLGTGLLRYALSIDLLRLLALSALNLSDVVLVNSPFLALKIAINVGVRLRLSLRLVLLLLLLLKVLQGRLNLQPLLQIVVRRIFQATVADEVVELVACLYNVEIEDVVKADYILFLEDTNIAIYVQVLQ